MNIRKYELVVFDFDDTLVESVELKQQAWEETFPAGFFGIKPIQIVRQSEGLTRVQIIEEVYEVCRPTALKQDFVTLCLRRFSALASNKILSRGLSVGVYDTIEYLQSNGFSLGINSLTPEDELIEIVHKLGVDIFFGPILGVRNGDEKRGAQVIKNENLLQIVEICKCSPTRVLVVGDSTCDEESAKSVGADFVGMATKRNGWRRGASFSVIRDMRYLLSVMGDKN